MSLPPDDRGGELRALFFESAYELLQALNEEGLALEAAPADEEILRRVRRCVHTLKGDSAACGFHTLSELAHELEDVLSPDVGKQRGAALAETVLAAADLFDSLLAAYKGNDDLPETDGLRARIRSLLAGSSERRELSAGGAGAAVEFAWNEYEQLMISEALHRGESVFNIALVVDPDSSMRAAAFQLVRNVLHGMGTLIALRPEDNAAAVSVNAIEAAVATNQSQEWVARRCRIPSVVRELRIEPAQAADLVEHEMLGELLEAQASDRPGQGSESGASTPGREGDGAVNTVIQSILRVDASRIESVMNLVGELIIGKSVLQKAVSDFGAGHAHDAMYTRLSDALAFQGRVLDELHKSVLKIRMVPVEQLFRRFPRIVRDVAKLCGKDVALEIAGKNTDLDKSILDALAEPLTHLVRNAVDHGIEAAEARIAAGKPARGTVHLNAFHQGTQVIVEVRDDGRGIDREAVRARATAGRIVSQQDAGRLSDDETLSLIFEPGLSTAREVTEVSGRGVGLDVVKTVLEKLKGDVHVSSKPGQGTTFQLRLPLTLASVQALLFLANDRLFAVPLSSVVEISRNIEPEVHLVDQREVLRLRDEVLTLVRLSRRTGIHAVPEKKRFFVVVIGAGEKKFGLVVDRLLGEEELVIKALPGDVVASDLISGASVLGDGKVVLILNVPAMLARLSRAALLEAIA